MNGILAARPASKSPGVAGQTGELFDVRWPDGRRFDSRRGVNTDQANLLVSSGICDEVRSPTGILRYLKLRRNPSLRKFASILAQADFTTTKVGILHQHIASSKKGH